ncbi:hypothetical protein M5X00_00380 [Paenibacillus alvei]|uniref:Uncharacterized protein n=1 Tax=Paenibacillus alvei TaxID=44250 RepID=A0ABT4GXG1_PAEAL|nr:hypothetical protein [Paenibacillus alvei]MCY7486583.1 hypothetical protein [Paenibacillus alvei]MCY9540228.1 hypothetical protein [Paenibacillus alvei]MCY9705750.1 hypothetical protein [Paenibacillus alvei]MCY9733613.1 hypothetical protein [Paenibacillus alvei]MCY9752716.1 hypothetical protein [Paenibacillus alvei]
MRRRIALLTVMAALLTCSFFNGPVQAETHTEVIESTAKSQLDSTVLEKVKAALGDIAKGNEMKSDLKVMANNSDNIDLEGELSQPAARFTVGYDKKKQRVNNATVYYQIKDKDLALESAVLKKVNAFIAKFEDKKYPLTFNALWRVKSPYQDNEPRNYWVFWGTASLDIDLDKGNKIIARQSYSSAQVDKKLLNKAVNAINQLRKEKVNLVRAERVKDEVAGSYFWHFRDHYDHHSVKIDAITNQVLEVDTIYTDWTSDKDFAKSFAKPKYTPKQAISAASGKVKSIFNVNLAGYKVTVKLNEYTFKKDKQPTIVGKINKKGEFYSFSLTP